MNEILQFDFEGREVRCVVENGKPLFCGVDICRGLEIKAHRRALARLPSGQKVVRSTHSLGGAQEMAWVTEGGLNTLILRSKQAVKEDTAAYRFLLKVTDEILPQIRRTGAFNSTPVPQLSRRQLIMMALDAEDRADQELAKHIQAEKAVEAAKPMIEEHDRFRNLDGLFGLTVAAKMLGIPPHRFIQALKEKHFLFHRQGALVAYQEHVERRLFEVKPIEVNGKALFQTFVRPEGLQYFARMFPAPPQQGRLPGFGDRSLA